MNSTTPSHNTPSARAALAAQLSLWLGEVMLWLAGALALIAPNAARALKRDVLFSLFDAARDVRLLIVAHAMAQLGSLGDARVSAHPQAINWRCFAGPHWRRAGRAATRGWRAGDLAARTAFLTRLVASAEKVALRIARRIARGLRHGGLAPMAHAPILHATPAPAPQRAHADTS